MIQKIKMDDIGPTLKALRKMDKEFKVAAKDQAVKISETEASRIKSAAHTRQQRLAAQTINARRGLTPSIVAGGSRRVTTSTGRSVKAGDVFFGAEFGSSRYPQFPAHRGRQGYFFWPTIRSDADRITDLWTVALDDLAKDWDN